MIVEQGKGREVLVRYRDAQGNRKTESIKGHYPYCFIETDNAPYVEDCIRKEDGYTGLYGEDLTKIVVSHNSELRNLSYYGTTWEANVPYVNRVLIDRLKEKDNKPFENYKHRTWYLDCEWSPATSQMRVIVVYDNFTENEYVWFVCPSIKEEGLADGEPKRFDTYGDYEYPTPALGFGSERDMLIHFLRHMKKQDPDIITGWYVVGADIRTIVERSRACGLNPATLSPMRRIRYKFGDWEQPIVGRNCIDLMIAFSKIWELKNGKLPSYKLDDVASEVLGEKKVELPDGHDTYYSDLPLYVHYCRQDVRLLPRLDSKVNALDYYTALQHVVQCDLRSTPFITKMFTSLALKDEKFDRRIPTHPQFPYTPYDGANVLEPETGVYENVGILDIKAMYHSNVHKYGISWDTLDPEGEDCGNGSKFNVKEKGLLCRLMDDMTYLRNENKLKMMMSDTLEKKNKWDIMQFACKSLVASMYGVAGDSKYGFYHPEVASAITYTSRNTLEELMYHAENVGFKVYYGHTDSIFCNIPNPEEGMKALEIFNEEMSPIETEFEKWCPSMLIMAKNRYAGKVSWTDGSYHDPKTYVKGIELKQSRMPSVMKLCMNTVIDGILDGTDQKQITESISSLVDDVVKGKVDPSDLCMKGKLERNLDDYKVLSGSSAGAAWANEFLGKGYRKGSFFKVSIDENGKYIAFDDPSDIEGVVKIGNKILAQRFILNKIEPYYNLAQWDIQPIHNSLEGISGMKWL